MCILDRICSKIWGIQAADLVKMLRMRDTDKKSGKGMESQSEI